MKPGESGIMPRPLNHREKQCARMIASGRSHTDCAKQLGLHRGTIARWSIRPEFKREVARLHDVADTFALQPATSSTQDKLLNAADLAIRTLTEILEHAGTDSAMMRLKKDAAVEILSRAGFSPVKQVNVNQTSVTASVSNEQIAALKDKVRSINVTPRRIAPTNQEGAALQ